MTYLDLANPYELTVGEIAERNGMFNNLSCRECRQPLRENEVFVHAMNLGGCEGYRLEHYRKQLAESLDHTRPDTETVSSSLHSPSCVCPLCMEAEELDQLRLEEDHV